MKKLVAVAVLSFLPVVTMADKVPQFVGFSEATVPGRVGFVGLHQACQGTFGRKARMCTSEEIFETTNLQSQQGSQTGSAWVHPVFVGAGQTIIGTDTPAGFVLDFSGRHDLFAKGNLTCSGWTNVAASGRGLAANESLGFRLEPCNLEIHAARCVPKDNEKER